MGVGVPARDKQIHFFSFFKLHLNGWVDFWFYLFLLPPSREPRKAGLAERQVLAKRGREAAERSEAIGNLKLAVSS